MTSEGIAGVGAEKVISLHYVAGVQDGSYYNAV